MNGNGVNVNRNVKSSDLVINHRTCVLKLQRFAKEVPNHKGYQIIATAGKKDKKTIPCI